MREMIQLIHLLAHISHATTLIPIDLAEDMTLLHNPSRLIPDNRVSVCLILAIS